MKIGLLTLLLAISTNSYSFYCATGKIKANECSGFIIEHCSFVEVNAVKDNGTFYEMKKCYDSVTDYKKGLCWIHIKASNIISKGINAAFQPDFYNYKNGKYTEIDAEYLVFKCIEK